jgi:hypothetical protein
MDHTETAMLRQWIREQLVDDEETAETAPPGDAGAARLLREVDAKRRVLERWWNEPDVLKILALTYADRPGCRDEWRS